MACISIDRSGELQFPEDFGVLDARPNPTCLGEIYPAESAELAERCQSKCGLFRAQRRYRAAEVAESADARSIASSVYCEPGLFGEQEFPATVIVGTPPSAQRTPAIKSACSRAATPRRLELRLYRVHHAVSMCGVLSTLFSGRER